MTITLRDWQAEALDRLDAARARGVTRALGVAATGLGKTILFCAYAERTSKRTLILAHRDELIEQAAAKVAAMMPDRTVGRVKGSLNELRADVVVASVQTLARANRLRQIPTSDHDPEALALFGSGLPPFDLVIVDEAHHAAARSYRTILDYLAAGRPACPHAGTDVDHAHERAPNDDEDGGEFGFVVDPCPGPAGPFLLGVTATPDRGDGLGLDKVFDEIVFSHDILWGMRAGYLADLRGRSITVDAYDTSDLKVRGGDYEQGQAGRMMSEAGGAAAIVKAWQTEAPGRRTLVFTPTVAFAEEVRDRFLAAGIAAGTVSGSTPIEERRETLARFASGDLDVLANCAVLTEGFDEPRVDCVVVARPTRSRGLYVQMIGRGTRLHPDKTDCLVLDLVGATEEHDLVTVPSLFGLDKIPKARRGERTVGEMVAERDAEEVRLGRLRAEDVELFRQVRENGRVAWVTMHSIEDPLKRYEVKLPYDRGDVVLAQRVPDADVWSSGLLMAGTKIPFIVDVPLEQAQAAAEDYVRTHGGARASSDAAWRFRAPSSKQLKAAKRWGITVDPNWTAGDVSDAIDRKAGRNDPTRRTIPKKEPVR